MRSAHIGVLGGGAWGTALAVVLAARGHEVRLWMREPDLVRRVLERRDNPVHLPGVPIPAGVEPTLELARALERADLVVTAIPSSFARQVYEAARSLVPPGLPVVVATKGIEEGTGALPAEVAGDVLGEQARVAVLSGPSFAAEVARGLPAAVVVASTDPDLARRVQDALSGPTLRLYTNDDLRGVQLAGALKNVIAIAAGAADGAGMGHSTMAALITRGLAEIRRLGTALGGRAETFHGLAGLGDLVLTCTGDLSRNRRVGQALGRGERLPDILAHTASVAEGVRTTRAARSIAARHGVETPIVDEVHRLLFEDGSARDAVGRLMARPLTAEHPSEREPHA